MKKTWPSLPTVERSQIPISPCLLDRTRHEPVTHTTLPWALALGIPAPTDTTEIRRVVGPSAATLDFPSSPPSAEPSKPLISSLNCRFLGNPRSGDDGRRRRRLRLLDGAAGLARLPRAHAPALRRGVRQVHQEVSCDSTPAPPQSHRVKLGSCAVQFVGGEIRGEYIASRR